MTLLLLLGCAAYLATGSIAPAPTTAPVKTVSPIATPTTPGSLWSEAEARALIGMDGNARRVGDLITVRVADTSSTSLGADTTTSRDSESTYGIGALLGLETSMTAANPNMGGKIEISGSQGTEMAGTGRTTREGTLAATLTCQVVEVLSNGNLRIRGTKEIRVNRETQFLTLEGILRPRDILVDNTVQSELLAEARIEFTGAGVLADKQGPGWATRLADTVWPF
jgi:flagellar L-ring protein precursor FlgH